LLNESFERRAFEFEPEFTNGLGEDLLEFRSGFFEISHWAIQSSTPQNQIWHGKAYRLCTYYCGHACLQNINPLNGGFRSRNRECAFRGQDQMEPRLSSERIPGKELSAQAEAVGSRSI
jgi:hypothetical protein